MYMLPPLLLWGVEDTRNIEYGVITGFKIIKLDYLRDLFVVKIIVSNLKKKKHLMPTRYAVHYFFWVINFYFA